MNQRKNCDALEPKKFPSSNALLLASTDFPPYNVQLLDCRHIIVAGGGGEAKTGVLNRINIYEIRDTLDACKLELVIEHDTGVMAIMKCGASVLPLENCDGSDAFLATAGQCGRVYKIVFQPARQPQGVRNNTRPHYRAITEAGHLNVSDVGCLESKIEQRCVKCFPRFNFILTGGIDGVLTVWKVNAASKFEIQAQYHAHSVQIDDIDVNQINGHVITLSQKENCKILNLIAEETDNYDHGDGDNKEVPQDWNLHEIEAIFNIPRSPPSHMFRAARFVKVPRGLSTVPNNELLTVCNPPNQLKEPSYLSKWDCEANYQMRRQVAVGSDSIMALDVSEYGDFIGLGTASGAVYIHESNKLERIYSLSSAHAIFVTALQFLPLNKDILLLTDSPLCSLLSVSADNHIVLHRPTLEGSDQQKCNARPYLLSALFVSVLMLLYSFIVEI